MTCHLCKEKEYRKCSHCGKWTCEFHLYKKYENRKSKKILDEICEKCLDKGKKK